MVRVTALCLAIGIILIVRMLSPGPDPPASLSSPAVLPPLEAESLAQEPSSQIIDRDAESPGGFVSSEVAPSESASETADRRLQTIVSQRLDELSGTYGVALQDLRTGETVLVNGDEPFQAASTYKLLVLYRVFEYIEEGRLEFDDVFTITDYEAEQDRPYVSFWPGEMVTVEEALELMITLSSNSAAHALARQIGGWTSVETAAWELGMPHTVLIDGYFWTTPTDMLAFLEALARKALVSEEASDLMIDLLSRQRLNGRIPALLPAEARVAHKTGELEGVRNDVGIVYGPDGSYAICVLSDQADVAEVDAFIAELARDAYDLFAKKLVIPQPS